MFGALIDILAIVGLVAVIVVIKMASDEGVDAAALTDPRIAALAAMRKIDSAAWRAHCQMLELEISELKSQTKGRR